METRIIQLESLAAMQDQTILNLNEEIYRQQQDISRLSQRLEAVEERLRELQNGEDIAGNERPPHW